MITDIQRFSLNDGPGIRTTVFFKGCPLTCAWCHNPESLSLKPQLLVYPQNCIFCGACEEVCPTGAVKVGEKGPVVNRDLCTDCAACAEVCYSGALVMSGLELSPEEVVREALKDKAYYDRSGGGVTLSGGEALMQPDLCEAVLKMCREHGVSTAVETCLNVPWASIERVLPYLDLMMLDFKISDELSHKRYTSVSNKLIRENLQKLSGLSLPLIIRTPVIPGVNDNEREIEAIAEEISGIPNLMYYELLNFNPLGDGKYTALGMDNPFAEARPLSDARMEELQKVAQSRGIQVRIG